MCPQAQAMGSVRNSAPSVLALHDGVCCLLPPSSTPSPCSGLPQQGEQGQRPALNWVCPEGLGPTRIPSPALLHPLTPLLFVF